jgi:hypothetical protein
MYRYKYRLMRQIRMCKVRTRCREFFFLLIHGS